MANQEELQLVETITSLYNSITNLPSLSPSEEKSRLFTRLVNTCLLPSSISIASLPDEARAMRSRLIKLVGEAEGLLESHYSTLISSQDRPLKSLAMYPGYHKYEKRMRFEFDLLSRHVTNAHSLVAFVGSGPLPLSSYMDDEEHEVYGGEIPDEADMDADVDMTARTDEDTVKLQELDEMKKRLKDMEEEAAALREMQAKVEKEMGGATDPASAAATQASKEEVDSRSVFVGNVDYACTPEEVQQHFQTCGTVNRVTILTDKFGQPKGFAYVEFVEVEAVQEALQLNESELHGRQLKVSPKRTNVPGMKQFRPRRFNPYMASRSRRPYMPYYSPFGYGKFPRFRRPMPRYMPYY